MQKQAIIIFLISLATADVLYFDQEYSLVPESQRRSELDKEIMAKKLDSKHDYPPSVCQDFRSGLLAAVDNYANLVKKHRQSKGFLTAFYELFVTENLRTLKLAQQEAWKETVLLDSDIKTYMRLNERRSSVTSFRSSMSS